MLHVDIYCNSPFSHVFLNESQELEITDNWNCNCLQSYVWGVKLYPPWSADLAPRIIGK